MGGIYIPNMEMPTKCRNCHLMHRCGEGNLDYICIPTKIYVEGLINACRQRPDWCPLIPIPDHGRLADVDDIEHISIEWELGDIARIIAPTIIPADMEE